jgi:hypothetical protein
LTDCIADEGDLTYVLTGIRRCEASLGPLAAVDEISGLTGSNLTLRKKHARDRVERILRQAERG